jgi:uncharacterized phage-associated protein
MNKYVDAEKALEVVLYVSQKTQDLFHIVKIIYYADKMHLEEYGRLIMGDYYVAMEDGPVPSGAYNLIKYARGDEYTYEEKIAFVHPERAIEVNENTVIPHRPPNLDYLSESDIECLNKSIRLYANMDGPKLWKLVHKEKSYNRTKRNRPIPLADIIKLDIPKGDEVIKYLDS